MNNIKLSVIMGVYNDTEFLTDAINSILNQTFKDFEFIICDDCSTDEQVNKILKEFAEKDQRIVLIENQINLKAGHTRNNCIEIAKGEYIAIMDSDDISLSDRFEKQVKFLDENPEISGVGTKAKYIDNQNNLIKDFSVKTNPTLQDLLKNNQFIHPSLMIRKSDINAVGRYTVSELTQRAEDYDLFLKLMSNGYKLVNLNKILFHYREDLSGLKKRKYKYRVQEYMLKQHWSKKTNASLKTRLYCFKPLIVGLVPAKLVKKLKSK